MQLTYSTDPPKGVAGQIARASEFYDIVTGVVPDVGRPEIADVVFAGVWAAADTQTTTVMGIPIVTTLVGGDDTIAEARNRALATVQANANFNVVASAAAVGTDTLRITGKQISDSGTYYDLNVGSSEVTAGSGTAVATTTQQSINAGDVEFGVGMAVDQTDDRGKVVAIPAATSFIFAGVTVMSHAVNNRELAGLGAIPATHPINLLKRGYIFLVCEDGCEPGDPVYLRHTTNGTLTRGHFRTDADTNRADAITGARWVTGADALGIAVAFFG